MLHRCRRYGTSERRLREVQAITAESAYTIRLHPLDIGRIHAALQDEVFHQTADFIVSESGKDNCTHAKAAAQSADDIVFSAAFPGLEVTGSTDPALAGIQAEHNFAERSSIITTFLSRFEFQIHRDTSPSSLQSSKFISRGYL